MVVRSGSVNFMGVLLMCFPRFREGNSPISRASVYSLRAGMVSGPRQFPVRGHHLFNAD